MYTDDDRFGGLSHVLPVNRPRHLRPPYVHRCRFEPRGRQREIVGIQFGTRESGAIRESPDRGFDRLSRRVPARSKSSPRRPRECKLLLPSSSPGESVVRRSSSPPRSVVIFSRIIISVLYVPETKYDQIGANRNGTRARARVGANA